MNIVIFQNSLRIPTISKDVYADETTGTNSVHLDIDCNDNPAFEVIENKNKVSTSLSAMEEDPNYLSLKNLEYSMPRSRASSLGNIAVDEEAKWLSWAETQFSTIAGEDRQIDLDEFKSSIGVKEVRNKVI